eukprot:54896-Amorphochlora_amoeboformis.AAC.1
MQMCPMRIPPVVYIVLSFIAVLYIPPPDNRRGTLRGVTGVVKGRAGERGGLVELAERYSKPMPYNK